MSARAHVAVDVPGLVIVHVDHTIFDSFSRSVLPTATRKWRRAINARGATHRQSTLAPDFTVQDHTGRARSLSDYRGKNVVLWFYPKADTPG